MQKTRKHNFLLKINLAASKKVVTRKWLQPESPISQELCFGKFDIFFKAASKYIPVILGQMGTIL